MIPLAGGAAAIRVCRFRLETVYPPHVRASNRNFDIHFEVIDGHDGSVLWRSDGISCNAWNARDKAEAEGRMWLDTNYPDHEDPAAYWDQEGADNPAPETTEA
jgi:hypothetical protein